MTSLTAEKWRAGDKVIVIFHPTEDVLLSFASWPGQMVALIGREEHFEPDASESVGRRLDVELVDELV